MWISIKNVEIPGNIFDKVHLLTREDLAEDIL